MKQQPKKGVSVPASTTATLTIPQTALPAYAPPPGYRIVRHVTGDPAVDATVFDSRPDHLLRGWLQAAIAYAGEQDHDSTTPPAKQLAS